jgi:hypothetical protein
MRATSRHEIGGVRRPGLSAKNRVDNATYRSDSKSRIRWGESAEVWFGPEIRATGGQNDRHLSH